MLSQLRFLKYQICRYDSVVKSCQGELLVTGSDDHTLFLWRPDKEKKPIARMTGT